MADLPGFFRATGMPDPDWWEALWPEPAQVLARLGLVPGMEVLDLCSGDGWFTLPIAKIARSVLAIDLDRDLLDIARRRLKDAGVKNCHFLEGDAFGIAERVPKPVDYVFLGNVFHGVPDRPRLVRAVRQSLKPGGLFALVSWHARPREETMVLGKARGPASDLRMTPEETIGIVEPCGFKLAKLLDVSLYHYGAVFRPDSSQ